MDKTHQEQNAPPVTHEPKIETQQMEKDIARLRRCCFPAVLRGVVAAIERISNDGLQGYVDRVKSEAGAAEDPIASIMTEQILLLNYQIQNTHVDARGAPTHDVRNDYLLTAARLSGELRQLIKHFDERAREQAERSSASPALELTYRLDADGDEAATA